MTITQRIELRRLGYSKDEIAELAAAETAPEPAAAETAPEPAAAETAPEPMPQPAPEPAAAAAPQPTMADVLAAITNLTTALQKQNINNTPQPVEPQPETAADIFTNMLKG